MSSETSEREIDGLLAALPRERAGSAFTGQVLARLDRPRWRRHRRVLALVAATATALLLATGALELWQQRERRAELAEQITALRRDHARLSVELRRLRARMSAEQPVLYLGGDDRVDYVLDLRHMARTVPVTAPGRVSQGEEL